MKSLKSNVYNNLKFKNTVNSFLNLNTKMNFGVKLEDFKKNTPHQNGYVLQNYFGGKWHDSAEYESFLNPKDKHAKNFLKTPNLTSSEMSPIIKEMKAVPCSGLHNPMKNIDRYLKYGDVCRKVSEALHDETVFDHFVQCINTVFPKSVGQSRGEFMICRNFFDNFAGDNVRYLARGFSVPGDYNGQQTAGYRWPYGPVAIINPFNYPLEIPLLQLMGALFMGNKVLLKGDSKVALPLEEFVRFLFACGLPKDDIVYVHSNGRQFEELLLQCDVKNTMFTGSSKVCKDLTIKLGGRIKKEDSGLDWKILGPDVRDIEYVAHMTDHDAYALSGQKCSAESLLFVHENWTKTDLYSRMKSLAAKRSIKDWTICPILSWTTKQIQDHVDSVLKNIKGAELLFGGKTVSDSHNVPDCYGVYEPTAIKVPLSAYADINNHKLLHTEVFGPYKLVVEYKQEELDYVLKIFNDLEQKLTCGVISNDAHFLNYVLGNSSNGTTYAGIRGRTTGAPQNHWFGPGGDPSGGCIGSIEGIQHTWSHHREIVTDKIVPEDCKLVQS
jgi:1-pyrroline-5-carboxylate dehydrogenase